MAVGLIERQVPRAESRGPVPVYTLFHAPREFTRTLTPQIDARYQDLAPDCRIQGILQETRWINTTKVAPEDSRFTIGVPIHNEEVMLQDSIASIICSDIPASVPMQVILVNNASTDTSASQIKEIMEGLGEVASGAFTTAQRAAFNDPGLSPFYQKVQVGEQTFISVNTRTSGKANALNLVNTMALQRGDRIAMSVDANNFVEQAAIPIMYGDAYKSIITEADSTVILSGNARLVNKNNLYSKVKNRVKRFKKDAKAEQLEKEDMGERVQGWFMAWDTNFVNEIEGFPAVVTEDYAVGVKAVVHDRKTKRIQDAKIWGYSSGRLRDSLAMRARLIQGKLQTAQLGTVEEKVVKEIDASYAYLSIKDRLGTLESLGSTSIPFRAAKFLLWEAARIKGKHMFEKDPNSQSWKSIVSTKGEIRK